MPDFRPASGGPVRHLYVHIPFCHRICPYCSFYKHTPGATDIGGFVDALLSELSFQSGRMRLELETIYFGGGTPSMLSPAHLGRLLDGLHERLDLGGLREWTMEANPRTFDRAKIRMCVAAGVTRVSLGVQSWNPLHLGLLGRDHSPKQARDAYAILRAAGVPVVNIDQMFALPGQSLAQWEEDLLATLALGPDHISTYNLTYEEDTEFLERFRKGEFRQEPDEDARFFLLARGILGGAGFEHYEISNYAKRGGRDLRSLHNRAYWRGADYLGLGPGAVSTIDRKRWTNLPDTARFIDCVTRFGTAATGIEDLSDEEWRVERIALELRTSDGLRAGLLTPQSLARVTDLETEGLLEHSGGRIRLTARGMLLADSVAAALL